VGPFGTRDVILGNGGAVEGLDAEDEARIDAVDTDL
jgi:hypothetical protein